VTKKNFAKYLLAAAFNRCFSALSERVKHNAVPDVWLFGNCECFSPSTPIPWFRNNLIVQMPFKDTFRKWKFLNAWDRNQSNIFGWKGRRALMRSVKGRWPFFEATSINHLKMCIGQALFQYHTIAINLFLETEYHYGGTSRLRFIQKHLLLKQNITASVACVSPGTL